MVSGLKLWFNCGMMKDEAIALLGGSAVCAADLMGVTYQAINKWPSDLPHRISDRVLGVCVRNGIAIPRIYLEPKPRKTTARIAQAATKSVAQGVA